MCIAWHLLARTSGLEPEQDVERQQRGKKQAEGRQVVLTKGDAVTCNWGGSRKENHMRSPGGGGSQTHRGPLKALMSMLSFSSILHMASPLSTIVPTGRVNDSSVSKGKDENRNESIVGFI